MRSIFLLALPLGVPGAWESPRVPPEAGPPAGIGSFSAATCAGCHAEIAAEWAASTHAHAFTDPQYQAERAKDPVVAWLCDNCHTPLSRQQAVLSVSTGDPRRPVTRPNPGFDPALQKEGVTCLSCHWRPDGIAGVHANPAAPHRVIVDESLRTEAACTRCHQANARVSDTLVCAFDTGEEWRRAAPGRSCPECHMPRVTRAVVPGGPLREGGRHLWPGALVPKGPQSPAEAAMFSDWKPGVALSAVLPKGAPGGTVTVELHVSHQVAGHRVPTADPERYLLLQAEAVDASGRVLATVRHRIGQEWTWWPVAEKHSDNRLSPGEDRRIPLTFAASGGAVHIRATLDHFRISPENAALHGLSDHPQSRRVATLDETWAPQRK